MAKLSKGTTFTDGPSNNAAAFNNLVDLATILPGAITEQSAAIPATGDSLLIYDTSGSALAKCTLQDIIDAFPGDAAAGTKALRSLGTAATNAAAGNDSRFPASVAGIRKSTTTGSTDVAAAPKDFAFAPLDIHATSNIDWDLADVFLEGGLGANKTYTFSNLRAGRSILLVINQNGHTVTFPAGWIVLGTPNTAGWNLYSMVNNAIASIIVCSS